MTTTTRNVRRRLSLLPALARRDGQDVAYSYHVLAPGDSDSCIRVLARRRNSGATCLADSQI